MALDPLAWVPSVDIDADDPTVQGYQAAINRLRDHDLGRAGADQAKLFRGIPITYGWRRVNFLSSNRPTVSILIDAIDSYLVAIRTGDGTWLRYSDRAIPLPDAPTMGLHSSYTKLTIDLNRHDLVFGTPTFTHAYNVLSSFNPNLGLKNPTMKMQRKVMIQLAVLFCEAVRFKYLLERLLEIMISGESHKLPRHMWAWLQNWSGFSSFALNCKSREDLNILEDDPDDVRDVEAFGIHSRDDIAAFLGLISHTA